MARIKQRYFVQYSDNGGWQVYDSEQGLIVFTSHSKTLVIAKAQDLNGYKLIDGNENTYAQQTRAGAE